MKRMKHPLHGFHHVYNKNEEDTMRLNGWVDDVPAVDVPAAPTVSLQATPEKRSYNRKEK